MSETTKEQVAEVLESLAHSFQNETDAQVKPLLNVLLKEYEHLDFTDPEKFNIFNTLAIQSQTDVVSRTAVQQRIKKEHIKELNPKIYYKVQFIWEQWDFIEKHLEKIIEEYEGFACSSDKSRWIINSYLQFLLTNKHPEELNNKERKFWHPNAGTFLQWISFTDSIIDLYYGEPQTYMSLRETLIKAEKILQLKEFHRKEKILLGSSHFSTTGAEKDKIAFYYENKDSGETAAILMNNKSEVFYRFKSADGNRVKQSELPTWFQALLEQTH